MMACNQLALSWGEHEKEDMVTRMRTLHLSDQLDGGA